MKVTSFRKSFEVFNRKFTPEEITNFYMRTAYQSKPRQWNYNPHIHGDRESYDFAVKHIQTADYIRNLPKVQARIREENKEKIAAGEKVELRPYDLTEDIDRTSAKQQIETLPWGGWKPLH